MSEQIYLIFILIFIIFILSHFIVRLYQSEHPRAKGVIFYFRMLLGFLLAMIIYFIIEIIKGHNILERFYGN